MNFRQPRWTAVAERSGDTALASSCQRIESRVKRIPAVGSRNYLSQTWLGRFLLVYLALAQLPALAADRIPPAPTRYFTQYTQLVSQTTAEALNQKLEEFEKKTSSQILVVIFPRVPEGAALEDFTVRAAQAWRVGQKNKDNGAVLFIFVADHKIRIEVGYGLEGAIPDAIAKRIIDDEIRPRFQQRDMQGGVIAGVNALMQAAQGEYRGTGTTVAQRRIGRSDRTICGSGFIVAIIVIFLLSAMARRLGGSTMYHRRRRSWGTPWVTMGGLGGWGGGGSRGGGGGFSGGGGSFGGGGASGGW